MLKYLDKAQDKGDWEGRAFVEYIAPKIKTEDLLDYLGFPKHSFINPALQCLASEAVASLVWDSMEDIKQWEKVKDRLMCNCKIIGVYCPVHKMVVVDG